MQEDSQFQSQAETKPGTNPLLFVLLAVVVLGGGAWYFLGQPTESPAVVEGAAPAVPVNRTPAVVVEQPVRSEPIARTTNALIAITPTATAQRQAVASAGKDDPFRTVTYAPKPIVVAPILKPVVPVSAPIPKEFFSKSIIVLGIVSTPKQAYAILSYEGRNEIARTGDAVKTAIVKSISAQSRTVTFRENGEEITRALEVGQS